MSLRGRIVTLKCLPFLRPCTLQLLLDFPLVCLGSFFTIVEPLHYERLKRQRDERFSDRQCAVNSDRAVARNWGCPLKGPPLSVSRALIIALERALLADTSILFVGKRVPGRENSVFFLWVGRGEGARR